MQLTYFGANSWLIDLDHTRILLDPWLVGDLVFGNQTWLFRGYHRQSPTIPTAVDLILLSQGLEDHAHRPTLKQLDHSLPVLASPGGAQVAQQLGYQTVTSLEHGQIHRFQDRIEIETLPGAPIGLQRENAYILRDLHSGHSLYYEPHGFYADSLPSKAPVDVVISPIVSLKLPVVGAIIQGHKTAIELAQQLQPQIFLPTAAGGDVEYDGILDAMLSTAGSIPEFRQQLQAHQLSTQVIEPETGHAIALPLQPQAA